MTPATSSVPVSSVPLKHQNARNGWKGNEFPPSNPSVPGQLGTDGNDWERRERIEPETLLSAADRACDHWQDDDSARQEMRRQIAEVQPEHYAGLLAHFERTYPAEVDHE